MSKRNRTAGNAYEREKAQDFRGAGFPKACTSRSESKNRDDAGVDLCHTGPWNIQCKRWKSAPSYHKTLKEMPQEEGQTNVILHKRPRQGEVAVMPYEDFLRIVNILNNTQQNDCIQGQDVLPG